MRYAAAWRGTAWRGAACLAVLGWMACGGGGGSAPAPRGPGPHPPVLADLSLTPPAVYQGASGDTAPVTASFSFTDAGGDLDSLGLQILGGNGALLQSISAAIPGASGLTAGTLNGQITTSIAVVDLYTFRFTVTDKAGSVSNALSGTFRVAASPFAVLPVLPSPRARAAGATLGGLVYALGGGDAYGNAFATVEAFDPASGQWSTQPPMSLPRDGAVAGVIDGKLFVAAGGLSRAAEAFDPATGAWSAIADLPTGRSGAAGCALGGRLFVLGGNQGMDLATVEAYDPGSNTWTTCAPLPAARSWAAACALNGKLYVVGGYASATASPWLNRLDIYDPGTDSWTSGPPLPAGPGLLQHVALALNGQVVVFGGANADRALDTVYRFDPAAGTWTPGARLPRAMAQFGGAAAAGKGYLFDGTGALAYDPVLDLGPLP